MSAFGYERVACALLAHRPPTPRMLLAALKQEDKKQDMLSYIGDTLWRMMIFRHPDSQVPSFSRYVHGLDHPEREKTGQEIVDEMIEKLKRRREGE